MKKDNEKIFNIDNRGSSLFIELVYSKDISIEDSIYSFNDGNEIKNFKNFISFVAIKNGEHNGLGYLVANYDLKIDKSQIKLEEARNVIESEFS